MRNERRCGRIAHCLHTWDNESWAASTHNGKHPKEDMVMKISVTIEGMAGLTWPRWKRLVNAIEQLGFAGLFRSDHFTLTSPPDLDSLEMVVSLTYLATHSERVHFGSLVAPLTFRDPIMLARQAMAIDDL